MSAAGERTEGATLSALFGRRVAQLRVERGWSLRDLAQRLGLSHASVHDCEHGGRGNGSGEFGPRLDTILRYAKALGVSPCELIPEREEPPA